MGLLGKLKSIFTSPGNQTGDILTNTFARSFGYRFKNHDYLLEALTHRSYAKTVNNSTLSYERMEYLGDAILGAIVSEYLYNSHPDYNEGDLTKTKAFLVNEMALSTVGRDCGLNSLILISAEEEKSGGRNRNSMISDAVEAVIGAIYLDSGLNAAREFVYKNIISRKEEFLADASQRNYKGELLEYLQGRGEPAPHYEVLSETGPDHDKTFKIAVPYRRQNDRRRYGAVQKRSRTTCRRRFPGQPQRRTRLIFHLRPKSAVTGP